MATSPALDLKSLSEAATRKGVQLLSAADFTHPLWRQELGEQLVDDGSGLFRLQGEPEFAPRFVLGTEISCVWRDPPVTGRGRRVHLLLFAPDFDAVDALTTLFGPHGALASDGHALLSVQQTLSFPSRPSRASGKSWPPPSPAGPWLCRA